MTAEKTPWTACVCLLLVITLPLFSYPLSWLPASVTPFRSLTLPIAVMAGAAILFRFAIGLVERGSPSSAVRGSPDPASRDRGMTVGLPFGLGSGDLPPKAFGVRPREVRGRETLAQPAAQRALDAVVRYTADPFELPRPLLWPTVLLFGSLLLSVRFSRQPHLSVAVLPVFISNLCLLWLGTRFPIDRLRLLIWCWLAAALVVAVNGLVRLGSDSAMLSTIGNQNVTAAYLAAAVPLALALRNRWSYLAGALLLAALVFCRSRGAWVAIGVLAVAGLIVANHRRRALAWSGAGAALLLVAGYATTQWRQDVRPLIWRSTARMVAAQPVLGHGLGTFLVNYPPFRLPEYFALPKAATVTDHAHNELLELAAEQGLVGLAATCWLWVVAAGLGWRACQARTPHHELVCGLMGAGLVLVLHGLLDVGLRFPPNQPLFWLLLGLLAGSQAQPAGAGLQLRTCAKNSGTGVSPVQSTRILQRTGGTPVPLSAPTGGFKHARESRVARFTLAGVCWAAAIWMFVAGVLTPVLADWWERRARMAEAAGDTAAAIAASEQALARQPFRPHTRYFLARILTQIPTLASQDAAIAELERLQELTPDYANVSANLGALLLARGRVGEAIPHLRHAVALNPVDVEARDNLQRALTSSR